MVQIYCDLFILVMIDWYSHSLYIIDMYMVHNYCDLFIIVMINWCSNNLYDTCMCMVQNYILGYVHYSNDDRLLQS